jgi:tagatose 1,6-diphosphate aldolase GatY/KbaY
MLMSALVACAAASPVPVCVQLDHASDLELIERALSLGAGAVMADGSRLPFARNLEWTREAVAMADRFGAQVEAELGSITGDEDVATAVAAGALTDPAEAAELAATGIACLAVSIGNVHGAYRHPPRLDWERLEAIRARCAVPLSLHGASGIPGTDVRRSIAAGIAKVNVNTELRERYLATTVELLPDVLDGAKVLRLNQRQSESVSEVVDEKLALLAAGPVRWRG